MSTLYNLFFKKDEIIIYRFKTKDKKSIKYKCKNKN